MILVLALAGSVALLGLPGWAASWGRRLPAREWARLVAGCLVLGVGTLGASLVLLAGPILLGAAGLPGVAAWCLRMLGAVAPGGPAVGWMSAGALVALGVLGTRALGRAVRIGRRVREAGTVGRLTDLLGREVLLLPAAEPVAMTVAGRVAVSRGLVEALSEEQLEVVLRHEVAHLRHRHQRRLLFGRVLRGALGWLGPVGRSLEVHEETLERWADEEAAGTPRDREMLRGALLAAVGLGAAASPALATPDTVVERIRALEGAPPAPAAGERVLLYAPLAPAAGAAVASLVLWLGQAQVVLGHSGLCLV